jgi:hypothetical protein
LLVVAPVAATSVAILRAVAVVRAVTAVLSPVKIPAVVLVPSQSFKHRSMLLTGFLSVLAVPAQLATLPIFPLLVLRAFLEASRRRAAVSVAESQMFLRVTVRRLAVPVVVVVAPTQARQGPPVKDSLVRPQAQAVKVAAAVVLVQPLSFPLRLSVVTVAQACHRRLPVRPLPVAVVAVVLILAARLAPVAPVAVVQVRPQAQQLLELLTLVAVVVAAVLAARAVTAAPVSSLSGSRPHKVHRPSVPV